MYLLFTGSESNKGHTIILQIRLHVVILLERSPVVCRRGPIALGLALSLSHIHTSLARTVVADARDHNHVVRRELPHLPATLTSEPRREGTRLRLTCIDPGSGREVLRMPKFVSRG